MAHFARLNEDNIVQEVIVINNNELLDENGVEDESLGVAFCQSLYGSDTIWKQTSYNSNFRYYYAGPGDTYSHTLDAFIPPKPFDSWVLDTNAIIWNAPIEKPSLTQEQFDAGYYYVWDEVSYQEDNTTGWVLRQRTPWNV